MQICIADNCSTDNTSQVIIKAQEVLSIKYKVNPENLGFARNLLEVVQMADGQFVWVLGDDDLLMLGACERIIGLIKKFNHVDYFYVNANHLTTEYVEGFPQPFNLKNLPKTMMRFSSRTKSGEIPFLKLIDPRISFDYLGGIFLSVFRRSLWMANVECLDERALKDGRILSHFDNSFPHIKIFAHAFSKSLAYFSVEPASACLSGAREWAPMGPLVMSIRLAEALEVYRDNGLEWGAYFRSRNAMLSNFFADMLRLTFNKKDSGGEYVKWPEVLLKNCIFPNFYLSFFYIFFRKSFWIRVGNIFLKSFSVKGRS